MEEISDKIYRYGDNYYTIDEIYDLYKRINIDKRKLMTDCICHYIFSEIFKKAGDKHATDLETLANLEFEKIESVSKTKKIVFKTEYNRIIRKILGLGGYINKYKRNELVNGEWLLKKIVSLTIGSNYEVCDYHGFSFIKYDSLDEDVCKAIVDNFKRNIWNEDYVFYNSPKTLRK